MRFLCNFVPDMEKILNVHRVNDYAEYIGAPVLHPLVSGSTVTDTADQLGFEHPQHFTRQFKTHFGVTPTEFLKLRK